MTMKDFRVLTALSVFLFFLYPVIALGGGQLYLISPNPPFWPDSSFPVPYNINPGSAEGYVQGVDPAQQFADAVIAAFNTWEAIPTSRITFSRGPDSVDRLDTDPEDDANLMVFHNTAIIQGIPIPLPPGVLGITNTVFDRVTGEMQGGSITLNTNPLPNNPDPDWSTSGDPGSIDIEAVILHEGGHFQGLSHSAVRYDAIGSMSDNPSHAAVMFPFLGNDVIDGRTPDADDIGWHGFIYPSASYSTTFGTIRGEVPFGSTLVGGCISPQGANGAHVVARDLNDLVGGEPRMIVGTYSYTADGVRGPYTLPGLPPGDYGIWIEPLDGSPVYALQINSRIQFTLHTAFPEDWYSGESESGTESDRNNPANAVAVPVTAGSTITEIDVIIANNVVPLTCMFSPYDYIGYNQRDIVSSQGILLLPIAFIYLTKRRKGKR